MIYCENQLKLISLLTFTGTSTLDSSKIGTNLPPHIPTISSSNQYANFGHLKIVMAALVYIIDSAFDGVSNLQTTNSNKQFMNAQNTDQRGELDLCYQLGDGGGGSLQSCYYLEY